MIRSTPGRAAIALFTCSLIATAVGAQLPGRSAAPRIPFSPDRTPWIPKADQNTIWYRYTESDTVIVFVHGILSDSRVSWLHRDETGREAYWPALIAADPRFGNAAIYLAGYETAIGSGDYGLTDIVAAMRDDLQRRSFRQQAVLDKRHVLFVTHSTGGIVVRSLLLNNRELFASHDVGLMLFASPTMGSGYANSLEAIIGLVGNDLARVLREGDPLLRDLHQNFRNLVSEQRLRLAGAEACEHHFIVAPWKVWMRGPFRPVVTRESCAVYFAHPRILPGTDHFTIVKPPNQRHAAHVRLADFFQREFGTLIARSPRVQANVRADIHIEQVVEEKDAARLQPHEVDLVQSRCGADSTIVQRFGAPAEWRIAKVAKRDTTIDAAGGGLTKYEQTMDSVIVTLRATAHGAAADGACRPARARATLTLYLEPRYVAKARRHLDTLVTLSAADPVVELPFPRAAGLRGMKVNWNYVVQLTGLDASGAPVAAILNQAKPAGRRVVTSISNRGTLRVDASALFGESPRAQPAEGG